MIIEVDCLRWNPNNSKWKSLGSAYVPERQDLTVDHLEDSPISVINSFGGTYGNIDLSKSRNQVHSWVWENEVWKMNYASNVLLLEEGKPIWIGKGNLAISTSLLKIPVEWDPKIIDEINDFLYPSNSGRI